MTSQARFTETELSEFFGYLDGLRQSGVTNMFGAAPYVAAEFEMPLRDARAVLSLWTKTFSDSPVPQRAERAREIQSAA